MGAADVVPGVSGGTVAFISGIYAELLNSIRACTPAALMILVRSGPRVFWQHINGTFLAVLFSGVLCSVATLAKLITYLLEQHTVLVWSFFFGLIVASVLFIWRQLERVGVVEYVFLVLGIGLAVGLGFAPRAELEVTHLSIFGAGMLAICAMILPGISGSFILLLLGMYATIIKAVAELNAVLLAVFFAGCVSGLMVFSHVLSALLARYKGQTLSLLTGFLAGSLVMVWPWQIPKLASNHDSAQALHLLTPSGFAELVGDPPILILHY